jgi:hypothetical protein
MGKKSAHNLIISFAIVSAPSQGKIIRFIQTSKRELEASKQKAYLSVLLPPPPPHPTNQKAKSGS